MEGSPYYFPFQMFSNLGEFQVAPELVVRPFDVELREELLGIKSVEVDDLGWLTRWVTVRPGFGQRPFGPEQDLYYQLFASNYVLVATDHDAALDFNFALKLVALSRSALYIGFKSRHDIVFILPPSYFGESPLTAGEREVENLRELTEAIRQRRDDEKLSIMRDMYRYAMSRGGRAETQYIQVAIILEMILLPKSSTELAYRFALRLANVLAAVCEWNRDKAFELGKRIYSVRSKLAHSGHDKRLKQVQTATLDAARIVLAHYVKRPEYFEDENLDALCLGN